MPVEASKLVEVLWLRFVRRHRVRICGGRKTVSTAASSRHLIRAHQWLNSSRRRRRMRLSSDIPRRTRRCCCQCRRVHGPISRRQASPWPSRTHHLESPTLPCARYIRFRSGRLKAVVPFLSNRSTRLASPESRGQTAHGRTHLVETPPSSTRSEGFGTVSRVVLVVVAVESLRAAASLPELVALLLLADRRDRLSLFVYSHHPSDRLRSTKLCALRIAAYGSVACGGFGTGQSRCGHLVERPTSIVEVRLDHGAL